MVHPASLLSAVSRRSLLAGFAGTALVASLPFPAFAQNRVVFRHGVASGDPDSSSVVLWTRASFESAGPVEWELSDDPEFARIIRSGRAIAEAASDFTVKVIADRLTPGTVYYFRFQANGETSETGRTRCLPKGKIAKLGIALASCSNYSFGWFNAYGIIARDRAVDFVLHTGDYIYEYGDKEWGSERGHTLGRSHLPANEIVSLADYRIRHAQYKSDPDAQAMHAAHPLLACWDDHESANNPWMEGAQNHQDGKEGEWKARREASIRAYFEWMPVREPAPGRSRAQFWREYRFGDLAMLFTLETRHTARAKQVDYKALQPSINSMATAREAEAVSLDAPDRALLATELEADLETALTRSVKGKQPWRLIGNPMPIARTRVPDVVALGLIPDPANFADSSDAAKDLAWKGRWDMPFYPDTWDGYEWARERLYALSRRTGAGDLVFLTGDSHSFWANQLADASGRSAGIELGTAGITSPGDFVESGFDDTLSRNLDEAFTRHNPEVLWTDNMHQGFVRLELTRRSAKAHFIAVDTVLEPSRNSRTVKQFAVSRKRGKLSLIEVAEPSPKA